MRRLVVLEIQVSKKNPEHCGTSATGERCPWYVKYETLRRIDGVGVHSCRMFDTWRSPLEGPPLRAPDCIAGEGHAETSGLKQPSVSGS